MIRVGIFDRSRLSMLGLRFLLDREEDMVVEFASSETFPVAAGVIDCLLVDADLIGDLPDSLDSVARADGSLPGMIGLAADTVGAGLIRSVRSDITEILLKDEPTDRIVDTVRRVAVRSDPLAESAVARHGFALLSPREQEVLRHIAKGLTHDQAARRIGISHHTVDSYVKRIRAKLGANNKAQLIRAAITAHAF